MASEMETKGTGAGTLKVTWLKVIDLVGIHTARILLERAWLEVGFKFYEARLVRFDESGADFTALETAVGPGLAGDVGREFLAAFAKALARLTGTEAARRVMEDEGDAKRQ